MRTAKTLIRLGGYPGRSESSLGAQPYCWFCHEVAQRFFPCQVPIFHGDLLKNTERNQTNLVKLVNSSES